MDSQGYNAVPIQLQGLPVSEQCTSNFNVHGGSPGDLVQRKPLIQ